MDLGNRHVVVTGGGSGVGAETAQALARVGARVTIMGRRAAALRDQGLPWQVCDVTDPPAVAAAFAAARDAQGPIHVVVANAGAAESVPFAKLRPEQLAATLAVNLAGVVHCWQAALADMRAAGWGRLIAIASTAGLKGYPYVAAYCAAKHGVVGLTRALALELAETGITVNAICPGFTETPLLERSLAEIVQKTGRSEADARAALLAANPQRRFLQPDEIAGAVLWLCSDAARSVNGHALSMSGGEI
ncbi:MAG: SDR family oxidoreductase [Alphaproteobacteria bacterium]|nr:MAG: SDR family oxidoreductase [Alphaproteobacteria bacterium]